MRISYLNQCVGAYLSSYTNSARQCTAQVYGNAYARIVHKTWINDEDGEIPTEIDFVIPSGLPTSEEFDKKEILTYKIPIDKTLMDSIWFSCDMYRKLSEDHFIGGPVMHLVIGVINKKKTDITFYGLDLSDDKVKQLLSTEKKNTLTIVKNRYSATIEVYSTSLPQEQALKIKNYKPDDML